MPDPFRSPMHSDDGSLARCIPIAELEPLLGRQSPYAPSKKLRRPAAFPRRLVCLSRSSWIGDLTVDNEAFGLLNLGHSDPVQGLDMTLARSLLMTVGSVGDTDVSLLLQEDFHCPRELESG
jgi:hypothetical protein